MADIIVVERSNEPINNAIVVVSVGAGAYRQNAREAQKRRILAKTVKFKIQSHQNHARNRGFNHRAGRSRYPTIRALIDDGIFLKLRDKFSQKAGIFVNFRKPVFAFCLCL